MSNLIQATDYLAPEQLLREDTEEGLEKVRAAMKVFRCFRHCYQAQREKLACQVTHALWDFPSSIVFGRFDRFLKRLLQLEVKDHTL